MCIYRGKRLTLYQTIIFLDLSKVKALAEDNSNETQMMDFVFDGVENIVENIENAG